MSASPSTFSTADRDNIKVSIVAVVVIAAVVGFYYLANSTSAVRIGVLLAAVAIAAGIGWTVENKDKLKLTIAGLIVIAAVVAFYYLANSPLVLRLGIVLGATAVALGIGWTSKLGKEFFLYCQDSITETKKVVWPSRKETLQTTGVVVAFVLIMAVFLWVVDASLVWLVRILVGREA